MITETDLLDADSPRTRYAVVTPVRDDKENLIRLAGCLGRQARCPNRWVIVDDGSTDETVDIALELARRAPWITVVCKEGCEAPTRGAPIAEAFELGLAQLQGRYDVVARVDADTSMGPEFFARLLQEFERDPRLGIASGSRVEKVGGTWRERFVTGASVESACRAYRWDCLQDVLPLDKHRGWDGVDVVKARLEGWRTLVVEDLRFRHHRAVGTRDGARLKAWANEGAGAYGMGYRPLYLLFRSLYHAIRDPAAFGLLIGYVAALTRRTPRAAKPVRAQVRHDQRLSAMADRLGEVRGRRKRTLPGPSAPIELLLVAEPGGHLLELCSLHSVWGARSRIWATLDAADSRSLLAGESVVLGHGPTCRSPINLIRNLLLAWKAVSTYRPQLILGTGSGVVVPFIWVGRLRGVKTIYIECGGRVDRPSLSCRLVAPLSHLVYVQWPGLKNSVHSARYAGRIRWDSAWRPRSHGQSPGLVFATVGTSVVFPFDRLVESLRGVSGIRRAVVQAGLSRVRLDWAETFDFLPFDELDRYMARAETVVTHAGVGSVLLALSHGKHPIVMPRRSCLNEAVDDHQLAFAQCLDEAGLITLVDDGDDIAAAIASPTPQSSADASGPTLTEELQEVVGRLLSGSRG